MPRKRAKNASKGTRAERVVARKFGARAIGGPGKPDFVRQGVRGENKHWRGKVHSGVVRNAAKRGVTHLNASGRGGFTGPARKAAKTSGIKLSRKRGR